jgi:RNA polymerase sigma-70 factor (sigma-E family)
VSDEKISPDEAGELAACFAVHAPHLFGYACVVVRGDRAHAGDLVQAAFEAAGRYWRVLRPLSEEQRRGWLRVTLATIAVTGARLDGAARHRPPRTEHRQAQDGGSDPGKRPLSSEVVERCWQVIQSMPEPRHAVALLRWQQGMKENEIAAVLGMASKTVLAYLPQARRELTAQIGPDHPFAASTVMAVEGTSLPDQDDLLIQLYEQITELQGAQFAAGYDLAAGLNRYRAWLSGQAEGEVPDAGLEAAIVELYSEHYRGLVRLSALLVRDVQTAEEVVQDAFVAMHGGWQRLRDAEKALAYLRQAVVNRSRSVLRHRTVVDKNLQSAPPDMPSAEHGALTLLERSAVVSALRDLPERQRQAIVLRYYADLSEAEIADAMKISRGAVKSHTARGMAALRAALEKD